MESCIVAAGVNTRGVLYVATGEKYVRAATRSAATVRRHCPDLAIHLFCDRLPRSSKSAKKQSPFSSVALIENAHRRSKVDYFAQSPFDWTLYLDSDTAVLADIREMFRLLERFDIAMAHAHHRHSRAKREPLNAALPDAFPQFNGGVILYRNTPTVARFLNQWRDEFHKHAGVYRQDQVTMRHALWKSDVRLATLPPEYNVRYIKYHFLWSRSEAVSKILHLRRYHVGWFAWIFRPIGKLQMRIVRRLHNRGLAGLWRSRNGA